MSGTALYRALKSANADDELATQAAKEIDTIKDIMIRLDTKVNIVIGLNIAVLASVLVIILKSFF